MAPCNMNLRLLGSLSVGRESSTSKLCMEPDEADVFRQPSSSLYVLANAKGIYIICFLVC